MSYPPAAIVLVSALAVACTPYERYPSRDYGPGPRAEDSCSYYGYRYGTEEYRRCADREADYRRQGRLPRDQYSQSRVMADAQAACASYGLSRGSDRFDRCVQREIDYRRPN